jgi:hypothetical protein
MAFLSSKKLNKNMVLKIRNGFEKKNPEVSRLEFEKNYYSFTLEL